MANTLTGSVALSYSWDYEKPNLGGTNSVNQGSKGTAASLSSTIADNLLGGASLLYGPIIRTLAASGNETLDLTTGLNDLIGDVSINFARVKIVTIELLSAAQDSTNGTACSSIRVGNAAANQALVGTSPNGFLGEATATFRVFNGGWTGMSAGNALGVVVSGTAKSLKVVNEDGANAAAYRICLWGGLT